ncbi:uncharacterized protein L3040_007525 [Drepanopeziza brunnea f. sp. 'multigermtubi']|uniref:uncharacterized protein n=1 Tax=Drepanopeziza brunnea f. sp. 'multigermtubi' TaxID=698441 RepID=UPI00239EFA65|nr:hypothetical protein L3040_007525 [Drepanopeziza brunnea f. sp. 'multigermtubi']
MIRAPRSNHHWSRDHLGVESLVPVSHILQVKAEGGKQSSGRSEINPPAIHVHTERSKEQCSGRDSRNLHTDLYHTINGFRNATHHGFGMRQHWSTEPNS